MNANQSTTMYESVPVVSELNKETGFDPLKFIRRTNKGEKKLDLKYKKLWFRLKYPNGRIKLSALKITDQLAIIEARVYFDKNDTQPKASFIAQRDAKLTPGGLYIESAQHAAIDQALSDAGFGVQFTSATPSNEDEITVEAPAVTAENVSPVTVEAVAAVENETEIVADAVEETPAGEAIAETAAEDLTVAETKAVETAAEETADTVVEVLEEGEEIEEEAPADSSELPAYTADMSVEEICSMMSYEEAGNVIVPIGTCKGWTLAQVSDRRPASLKWYINGYSGNDNILRAAATIMQSALDIQKAS